MPYPPARPALRAILLTLLLAFVSAGGAAAQTAGPARVPESFADLAERLLPSVVNISTTQTQRQTPGMEMPQFPPGSPFEEFFRDFLERQGPNLSRRSSSLGSGFVVDAARGFIVTNNHVIADADAITVILSDNTVLPATLIGKDLATDLAVLKVETSVPLTEITWGTSETMRVGDWIVAIGNPFGLGGTVTAGIISARARNINSGPYDDYIQTDASINRGNSGGPMFNTNGEVIGINTAIFSPSGGSVGIGFAIPSDLARPIIAQLIEFGRTRRGWLGVRIQEVTPEIASSLGLDRARGALIASVTENGPAQAGGLKPGDVVLSFDGREVPQMSRLPRLVADTEVGRDVEIVYWRDKAEGRLRITVAELEEAQREGLVPGGAPENEPGGEAGPGTPGAPANSDVAELGLTVTGMTPELRTRHKVEEGVDGLVITAVTEGSPAAEAGFQVGDVIVQVDSDPVTSPDQFAEHYRTARAAAQSSMLLLVSREGDTRFRLLRFSRRPE